VLNSKPPKRGKKPKSIKLAASSTLPTMSSPRQKKIMKLKAQKVNIQKNDLYTFIKLHPKDFRQYFLTNFIIQFEKKRGLRIKEEIIIYSCVKSKLNSQTFNFVMQIN